jgi:DNA polymerase sigma
MSGVLVLGALGAIFQKKYNVQSINNNIEQMSIYAVAISPPAERKSEVIRHIIAPFLRYQKTYNSENKGEVSNSEAKRKELKAALFKAESEIDGTDDKRKQLQDAQSNYDNFTPLHNLTLLADDTTTEALVSLMVKNGERMFIASGESYVQNKQYHSKPPVHQ